jgi:hypothetical protein
MKFRLRLLALGVTTAVLAACGDPTGLRASLETVTDTLVLRAFTGASTSDATALNTFRARAVRAEITSGYDFVFDLDATGKVLIYPPSRIANVGRAGLQLATAEFEDITEAVVNGYNEDSTATANVGEVYMARSFPVACSVNIRPFVYSKFVIDSVNLANKTIHVRITVNPNCGFRSFAEGVPDF